MNFNTTQRLEMIEESHEDLSINRQCEILSISRSRVYYKPVERNDVLEDALMKAIDKEHLKCPFYGFRRMTVHLQSLGYAINRKRIRRLMKLMNIKVIYPHSNTSKPNSDHQKYPYLLRDVVINRANQVWSTDITYIPMEKGFMYCMAIIDWHTRSILHWSLSNTMEACWCTQVLKDCLAKYGKPEIFNTDQGSQFTANIFLEVLIEKQIRISMDGKGRALDNVFIERFWRSLKQEKIYLYAYENGWQLEQGIIEYMEFYNYERPHQSLDYKTPMSQYPMAA